MKRKLFLLIAISILFMTNCKKENTNGGNNILTSFISGTWTIDSTIIIYYQNDSIDHELMLIETPAYFNFFSSNQAYYRNLNVLDTTNYYLVGSDTIIIDLNNDNLLDTATISTFTPNHRLMFNWVKKYNIINTNEEKIYLHK
jgi:hypothetical protein